MIQHLQNNSKDATSFTKQTNNDLQNKHNDYKTKLNEHKGYKAYIIALLQ